MIPKVIHYCWFGGNPLPDMAKKCIASWKTFFPDYEIKEWNESNFDFQACDYMKEAYEAKKWAFVSDYARFWILYHFGGLYFDTDVEVIRNMEKIVERGSFMGCEDVNKVSAGLGLGAEPGLPLYREILEYYDTVHFRNADGTLNEQTVVAYVTDIMKKHGYEAKERIQEVDGVFVYPAEYFCPLNYGTGKLHVTENTVSIHHYSASWHSRLDDLVDAIERCSGPKGGAQYKARRVLSFPFRVANKLQKNGLKNTIRFVGRKLRGTQN